MSSPLALRGGSPAVDYPGPHFTWPPTDDATTKAVLDQFHTSISIYDRSGVIARLEDALCDYFGVKHAVLTSSGTTALYSMYVATFIEPGDEILVPAYAFFAMATPLLHLGAVPVLVDSDETGNMSVSDAASKITAKTTAIAALHLWGIPADLDGLCALADRRGLKLLEDASHAHGARIGHRKVGTFGHAAAFSMNDKKPLSAGEAGFALTDSDEVYYRLLLHGQYNRRCKGEIPPAHPLYHYAVTGMGLKFRIHPLAAAIALDQLGHLDDYLAGRAAIAKHICEQLRQLPGIAVPQVPDDHHPAWYGLPLTYQPEELDGLAIEPFYQALKAEGCVEVDRPGSTRPLNQLPLFRHPAPLFPYHSHLNRIGYREGQFPVAERVHRHTLKLPVWHREEDLPLVDAYIDAFRKVVEHHHELLGTENE